MKIRRSTERGVTLVEYAMGVALVLVASLGVTEAVADNAGDRLDERGSTVGAPGDEALGGRAGETGTGGGDDDGEVPPDPPDVPYTGDIVLDGCTGSPHQNSCAFSLTVPPAPLVPVWTTDPSDSVAGSGTLGDTATLIFEKKGTYSVRATIGSNVEQFEVNCTKNNGNISCVAAG